LKKKAIKLIIEISNFRGMLESAQSYECSLHLDAHWMSFFELNRIGCKCKFSSFLNTSIKNSEKGRDVLLN
jgi:hypothetical protein